MFDRAVAHFGDGVGRASVAPTALRAPPALAVHDARVRKVDAIQGSIRVGSIRVGGVEWRARGKRGERDLFFRPL